MANINRQEPNKHNTKHIVDDRTVRLDEREKRTLKTSDKEYEKQLERIADTAKDSEYSTASELKDIVQKERRARLGKGNIIQR